MIHAPAVKQSPERVHKKTIGLPGGGGESTSLPLLTLNIMVAVYCASVTECGDQWSAPPRFPTASQAVRLLTETAPRRKEPDSLGLSLGGAAMRLKENSGE
jgi:hypothetical protein